MSKEEAITIVKDREKNLDMSPEQKAELLKALQVIGGIWAKPTQ